MPTKRATVDLSKVQGVVESWYALKRQSTLIGAKLNEGKKALKEMVQQYGETDPTTGSIFLRLKEPVGDRRILTLKNQRSVSDSTNYERAEEILRKKGLWDAMTVTRTVVETSLDPDAIYAGFYDGKITEAELDQMFPKTISFSFWLLDENEKPVS
jgi:hypothetical protein